MTYLVLLLNLNVLVNGSTKCFVVIENWIYVISKAENQKYLTFKQTIMRFFHHM